MRYAWIFLLVMMSSWTLSGQAYNTVGGLRLGDDFGLSVSQRIAQKSTLELIYQPGTFAGNEMISLTGKRHYPLLTRRLNVFAGGGLAHRNIHTGSGDEPRQTDGNTLLALSLGSELSLGRWSLSVDYMPMVSFTDYAPGQRFFAHSGLSVRYVFVKRPKPQKKFMEKINIFKKKK
jgi:hypothetical protein